MPDSAWMWGKGCGRAWRRPEPRFNGHSRDPPPINAPLHVSTFSHSLLAHLPLAAGKRAARSSQAAAAGGRLAFVSHAAPKAALH